ncbi:MAG: DUF2911 domain-containing protein [Bacteroidota bacterium]
MKLHLTIFKACLLCLFTFSLGLYAQLAVTLPPSGGNQISEVSQYMGLVKVTVNYSSPDVAGREGNIWGKVVPYGPIDFVNTQGYGTATAAPWRAGANENTLITVSHDVEVEGKKLAAGTYGFHIFTYENEDWELVFSHETSAWGSYYYEEENDALRVKVTPEEASFHEYLTYEFTDRKLASTTLTLYWENMAVPFSITAPNSKDLYIAKMKEDLQSTPGFTWQGFNNAASFCLQNDLELEQGLVWAEQSVSQPYIGEANFTTLSTKGLLEIKTGDADASAKTLAMASEEKATAVQLYQLGNTLIRMDQKDLAIQTFGSLSEKYPDHWLSFVGTATSHKAQGEMKKAREAYLKAKEVAPVGYQGMIQAGIDSLEG